MNSKFTKSGHLYILTCFDSTFFDSGLTLIKKVYESIGCPYSILVFDMGLSNDQKVILRTIKDVHIIELPCNDSKYFNSYFSAKTYGFRSYIGWYAGMNLNKGSLAVYMDAGVAPVQNFEPIVKMIEKHEVFLVSFNSKPEDGQILSFLSDVCRNSIDPSTKQLVYPMIKSCLFGYKIGGKFHRIFEEVFQLSLQKHLISGEKYPDTAFERSDPALYQIRQNLIIDPSKLSDYSRAMQKRIFGWYGHRHDQSLLSLIAAKYDAPVLYAKDYCYASNESDELSRLNWHNKQTKYSPEFDVDPRLLKTNPICVQHRGLYINHHGLNFNIDRKRRAIIMGNGPSLRGFDFNRLKDFDVFGMNAAYRYWDKIKWYPQYFSCLDLVVGLSHAKEIKRLIENADEYGIKQFLLLDNLIKELDLKKNRDKVFNFDSIKNGSEAMNTNAVTTGSHTTSWASYLGYQEIYLIGIDSNYVEIIEGAKHVKGAVLKMEKTPTINPNYFFDDYQQEGDVYHIPNPTRPVHLQGWREIAGRLNGSATEIFNANLNSRVDAFDFCYFSDIEKESIGEILPREKVRLSDLIINSLQKSKQPINKELRLVILKNFRGLNLMSYLSAGWRIDGIFDNEEIARELSSKYQISAIRHNDSTSMSLIDCVSNNHTENSNLQNYTLVSDRNTGSLNNESPNKYVSNKIDYLYSGNADNIEFLSNINIPGKCKVRVIDLYFDFHADGMLSKRFTEQAQFLTGQGYNVYIAIWHELNQREQFVFSTFPLEYKFEKVNAANILACLIPLKEEAIFEELNNLDLNHLYHLQKYGLTFENIFKTDGVKEEKGLFSIAPPSNQNYVSYCYSGKVRPNNKIYGVISFIATTAAEIKLLLCRNGATPFEYSDKKMFVNPGRYIVEIEHAFNFSHLGVRFQIGVDSGTLAVRDIDTKIQIIRNSIKVDIEVSRTVEIRLSQNPSGTFTENPYSKTKYLKLRVIGLLYLSFKRTLDFIMPPKTKRRIYAALMKEKIVLFIQWVVNIFR